MRCANPLIRTLRRTSTNPLKQPRSVSNSSHVTYNFPLDRPRLGLRERRIYVATVPNRASAPAILLRESYRENGKVRNRTLTNLSDWPAEQVQSLRAVLRGDRLVPAGEGGFENRRSLLHGHVVAALATARQTCPWA